MRPIVAITGSSFVCPIVTVKKCPKACGGGCAIGKLRFDLLFPGEMDICAKIKYWKFELV